jgi:hypothetical protein
MNQEILLPTDVFAASFNVKASSVRRSLCVHGHYLEIRPVKLPNGRLGWPKSKRDELLNRLAIEQGQAA